MESTSVADTPIPLSSESYVVYYETIQEEVSGGGG